MTDYIDRGKIQYREIVDYYDEQNMCEIHCAVADKAKIERLPTADVVERKKYDLLQSGYETLKHQLEKSWDRIDELDKLNGNMRDKIDKAIKEMKALVDPQNTILEFDEKMGVKTAMNILVRSIRESEL